jgi:DNA-binding transcriptional LysR family regulator
MQAFTGPIRLKPCPVLVCSSMALVYRATLRGAGFALVPRWLIEEDLRAGRLRL